MVFFWGGRFGGKGGDCTTLKNKLIQIPDFIFLTIYYLMIYYMRGKWHE